MPRRSTDSFAERLVAYAAIEGIFFSGRCGPIPALPLPPSAEPCIGPCSACTIPLRPANARASLHWRLTLC